MPPEADDWAADDWADGSDRAREPRPVVFPAVLLPARVVYFTATALLGACALTVISALIRAVSYREPSYPQVGAPVGISEASQPPLSFADRMSIFTGNGADILIAVLIAVAVVLVAMPARPGRRATSLMLSISIVIAAIIVVANVIMFVEVLASAEGLFVAAQAANKTSSAISYLGPIVVAGGASWLSISRLVAHLGQELSEDAEETDPSATDTTHP